MNNNTGTLKTSSEGAVNLCGIANNLDEATALLVQVRTLITHVQDSFVYSDYNPDGDKIALEHARDLCRQAPAINSILNACNMFIEEATNILEDQSEAVYPSNTAIIAKAAS